MKYKVEIIWFHTIADVAEVEIEADSPEEAEKKGKEICDDQDQIDELEFEDGEIVEADYDVGEIRPVGGE